MKRTCSENREGKVVYSLDEDSHIKTYKRAKIGEDLDVYEQNNRYLPIKKRNYSSIKRSKNVNTTLPIKRDNGLSNYLLCMLSSFANYLFGKPKDTISSKFSSNSDYRIPDKQTMILLFSKILKLNEKFLIHSPWIDNYIIAMSFVYLQRANLVVREYNTENWLYALHLAWEMEEDFPKGKYVS